MGIITGYFCLAVMILLMLKFLSRIFKWTKINNFLMKYHKYIASLFLVIAVVHFILVIPVLKMRMSVITISGIAAVIAGFVIIVCCHLIKDRKKEIKFHRGFSILIICMAVIHMVFYQYDFQRYQTKIREITVNEVNLGNIDDNIYTGVCDAGYIYAKVQLTVIDNRIVDVELIEHRNERGSKANSIPDTIVSEQKIDVDAVTGATYSSVVIKKACENALRGDQ